MKQIPLGVRQVDLVDWRLLLGALRASFDTDSFAAATAFIAAVGRVTDEDGRLEIGLQTRTVGFALHSADAGGVTARDVRAAERISALAGEHGLTSRPDQLQVLELALDTPASDAVRGFWAAILTGTSGQGVGHVVGVPSDPAGVRRLWFQRCDSEAPDRQRFHVDVTVPPELADRRVAAALGAGGRVVDDSHAPAFVVLADPDGNLACVCTELGRE